MTPTLASPRLGRPTRPAALVARAVLVLLVLPVGCGRREIEPAAPPAAGPGAGNYCSLIGKLTWTSNRSSPRPPAPARPQETYNIFLIGEDGSSLEQLTRNVWPTLNQHPVFTPDCDRIVWTRGVAGDGAGSGNGQIWSMAVDGTDATQLSRPPAGEMDGHPWVAADGSIYFVRHAAAGGVYRLWQMQADGSGERELLGTPDRDRFHPALVPDSERVIYTAGPPGTRQGTEIRALDTSTGADTVLFAPGWPVSAATPHPDGTRAVVSEDDDGDGLFRVVEIDARTGDRLRILVDDVYDNAIPYYSHPAGTAFDYIRGPDPLFAAGARNLAWSRTDLSEWRLLTRDAWQDTKIVGEPLRDAATGGCTPRPVGCYPTPPPCGGFLLPREVTADAESLGRALATRLAAPPADPAASAVAVVEDDLAHYAAGTVDADPELLAAAERLGGFLATLTDDGDRGRVAQFYFDSYLLALEEAP